MTPPKSDEEIAKIWSEARSSDDTREGLKSGKGAKQSKWDYFDKMKIPVKAEEGKGGHRGKQDTPDKGKGHSYDVPAEFKDSARISPWNKA